MSIAIHFKNKVSASRPNDLAGLRWIDLVTDAQGGRITLFFPDEIPLEKIQAVSTAFNEAFRIEETQPE